MSDRIVAHTVTQMTLAYFCAYDTHLKKNVKAYISETITATATLSCAFIQLGMVLHGKWNR